MVGELFNEKMKFEMCLILKHGSSNRFSPSEYSREMCFDFVLTKDKDLSTWNTKIYDNDCDNRTNKFASSMYIVVL